MKVKLLPPRNTEVLDKLIQEHTNKIDGKPPPNHFEEVSESNDERPVKIHSLKLNDFLLIV